MREAALGRRVKHEIAGLSCVTLLELFHDCHAYVFDGGAKPHKTSKNKQIRTGFWQRLCWPNGQCLLEQPNIIVEAFRIINSELERMDL